MVVTFFIIIASGIIIFLAVFIPVNLSSNGDVCEENQDEYFGKFGRATEYSGDYKHAAVSADSAICSTLGTGVLKAGGNAIGMINNFESIKKYNFLQISTFLIISTPSHKKFVVQNKIYYFNLFFFFFGFNKKVH